MNDSRGAQLRALAVEAYRSDRLAVAIEVLTTYVRMNSTDAYALYVLGDSLRQIGRWAEAEETLVQARRCVAPDKEAIVVWSLASLFEGRGLHSRAELLYAELLSDAETAASDSYWIMRGANLMSNELHVKAEHCFRRAVTASGNNLDEAYCNLGLALRAQRRYSEATDALHAALRIRPDYEDAATALRSMEGITEAMQLLANP